MKVSGEEVDATSEEDVIDFANVFSADDPTQLSEAPFGDGQFDSGATAETPAATAEEAVDFGDVFDAPDDGQETAQVEQFSSDVFSDGEEQTEEVGQVDLDVGDSLAESFSGSGDGTTVKVAATDLALPEGDPTVTNEVGTKLDLARAYMEMGDPDGARGILQEVIEEGDTSQQQDARALLKALP